MPAPSQFATALGQTLDTTSHESLGLPASWQKYEGKVRDSYVRPDGTRLIVVTDRISAFDRVLGTLPFKGQILNRLAAHWLEETRSLFESHFVSMPDPTASLVRECAPLPLEVVMRGALTGVTSTSIWTHYERGARTFAGHALPEGMKKNELLPEPLFTPSTKAPKGGHDETVSPAEVLARGLVTKSELEAVEALAKALFAFGQRRASERGLILVDTKYELGLDARARSS
jgi:phosphoribosylaminoimidazole-succinocarboxamide synthase